MSTEYRKSLILIDISLLSWVAWGDYLSDTRKGGSYDYRYSRKVVKDFESNNKGILLNDFGSMLKRYIKVDGDKRPVLEKNIDEWEYRFEEKSDVIYTIPNISPEIKNKVGKRLIAANCMLPFSRRLEMAAAINYGIPTILTDSREFVESQDVTRELYESFNDSANRHFKIIDVLDYYTGQLPRGRGLN